MVEYGKLSHEEFERRCHEVFEYRDGDRYYGICITNNGDVTIAMSEIDACGVVYFGYKPDMADRPEALSYLMGESELFSD